MDLLQKLKSEIQPCSWELLKPHYERDALFIVEKSLNLFEAGIAIGQDQSEKVKKWIEEATLRRPSSEEVEEWKKNPKENIASFIIIQPYVLIQF